MHPLRVNVGFLLHQSVGYSRRFDFEQPAVQVGGDLDVSFLRGSIRFTRTHQGLVAQGGLNARTKLECVRCLAEFDQTISLEINELFVYPPSQANDPILVVPETGILDLNPYVREALLLDVPIQPLCRPECQGLCPECGANLNEAPCEHGTAEPEARGTEVRYSAG